jgi:hypothetical protein
MTIESCKNKVWPNGRTCRRATLARLTRPLALLVLHAVEAEHQGLHRNRAQTRFEPATGRVLQRIRSFLLRRAFTRRRRWLLSTVGGRSAAGVGRFVANTIEAALRTVSPCH